MTARNASTALASVVVDQLVASGVREVVLSPGSRSAPLAFAAYAAESTGALRLHTRIDERTAGFLALGLAKSSRRPVAVITTSGTAVANLHPAVLEASHAGLPLVALTADRPASLRGTNANQTTDQVGIYGHATAFVADIPAAVPGADELHQIRSWREAVVRALGCGGPAQLNLQFDEPLMPETEDGWGSGLGASLGDVAPNVAPNVAAGIGRTGGLTLDDRPTVVVAGDDAGPPARVLAERNGWPLFAEPSSGSRTGTSAIRTYRLLLADESLTGRIERVVVCGHPTLSRPVTRLISRADLEVLAAPGPAGITDPGHAVNGVLDLEALLSSPDGSPRATPWLKQWQARDAEVSARLDDFLAAQPELVPHHVAGAVAGALPDSGLLVVGASNPIRDLDLMVPRYRVGGRRMVISNRGLSGIDGTVSTAIGATLGRPHSTRAFALVGDVTFLHDATGLFIGPTEQRPDLMIVVSNDEGGSIFAGLEQGDTAYADQFEKLFGTPHGVDLAALCHASGTPHRRVTDPEELAVALATPRGGTEVVEAVVSRTSRRELDAAIRALV